jgi:hypothetical protein
MEVVNKGVHQSQSLSLGLWDSLVRQPAGPVEHQDPVKIGQHRLTIQTQHPLVPAIDLGTGLTRMSPTATTQQQRYKTRTGGKREKAQTETAAPFFPIFHSHHAFHHVPFSKVRFGSCAACATVRARSNQTRF